MSGSAQAEGSVVYDPADPQTMANPFPIYQALRRDDPVHWSPSLKSWVITRYHDVRAVLTDSAMTVERLSSFYATLPSREAEVLRDIVHYLNLWLAFQDPPSHTRLRRILRGPFAGRAIDDLRPGIEDIVAHVLDGLEGRDRVDVIADFALLVPAYVIMDMLDVPRDKLADFKRWSDDMATFIGGSRNIDDKYERAARGCRAMSSYFREIIEARRADPKPGFLMTMIEAGEDGQH
ncbi:MAG TPA: hypothetical protein DEA05_05315 [Rhodobacteraceae bacterium]|nr:hypothetical protein [Paracoccaceae bacterium]